MTPLLRHLGNTLDPLPPAATAAAQAATRRLLGKGEPLLRAGERWQQLWWVEAGCLRLYYLDRNGQASNKNFHTDQALLWPITPALREQPVHFWVEATEATTVWALPWAPWSAAVADLPAWQALERRVLALLLEDKMAREHAFLQHTAAERYQQLLIHHPDWARRVPLRHLASYLGITDVALSRIRRRLKHAPPLNPG
ncbi:MAG: Crp/Fnr family transcriptional regulator [Burkholderiaceae bacterium]